MYNYRRRKSREVRIGNVMIGGEYPIRLQSMTNTSTNDTEGSARQAMEIAAAGGEIVRLTTQGVKEARNMANIKEALLKANCEVPLVADVHFNPQAAFAAAECCDKVRINPGNFVDAARTFKKIDFSDEEYAEEIEKIRKSLIPFLDICKKHKTAVRLGVNHGSLSDRIMSRYGDTPAGMVESVMEYLRICRDEDFNDIVISIKASNTVLMVETVRLLVEKMDEEDMHFPLHLGVTEAGDGEDGRIKSAVGIGTLLAEGIGDTIRVSLSEPPADEIPVAKMLRDYITSREGHELIPEPEITQRGLRHLAHKIKGFEDVNYPIIIGYDTPEIPADCIKITSRHKNPVGDVMSQIDRKAAEGDHSPMIISLEYPEATLEELQVKAGADFGALLLNGYGNGIEIVCNTVSKEDRDRVALGILQAARLRTSKTEFISCPGCGRTLFDLQSTLKEVKAATSHLKGLKIGVMGCIVNGPGEMADADYGYVGAGVGRVSLYKGKELKIKNIPQEEAISRMIHLLKEEGDWKEPEA